MSAFPENDNHDSLQRYWEYWLSIQRFNSQQRFDVTEYTYHEIIPEKHKKELSIQNSDPVALEVRALPDLLVSDKMHHFSFYIEIKGPDTLTIEPTQLGYLNDRVKNGQKIIFIYTRTEGFVLDSKCIEGVENVYYHIERFESAIEREKQHDIIRKRLDKPDLKFIAKPRKQQTNGKMFSLDPYIFFNELLKGANVHDPKSLMDI